jgi:hypothetical protein
MGGRQLNAGERVYAWMNAANRATRAGLPTPIVSTSNVPTTATSPSGTAPTFAWARRSRGSRRRSRFREFFHGSIGWNWCRGGSNGSIR